MSDTERSDQVHLTVVLADDHALLRSSLAVLLDSHEDISVVAEVDDGLQAYRAVVEHLPDVLMVDLRMPELDGIDLIRRLRADDRFEDMRIIALTMYDTDKNLRECLQAGADGFLLKDIHPPQLLAAIRAVANGGLYVDSASMGRLVSELSSERSIVAEKDFGSLTERETEVLRLIADGSSNAEISERLFITVSTVKSHVSQLLRKLGARDRTQLALIARHADGGS